jgi:L-fuculose-phosphate aldolase
VGGSSIEEAYAKLETLEFLAQITHLSGAEPGYLEIPSEEVEKFLKKIRGSKE